MREGRKSALPLTWEEEIRWREEDRLDLIEVASDVAADKALKRLRDEEPNRQRGKRDRGFAHVQQAAIIAAGAVMFDQYGKREFPRTPYAMARAIADAAAEFGMELEPGSTSVLNVAACNLELADRLNNRKDP